MAPGAAWGGREAMRLTRLTLRIKGTVCHLCHEEGATTADHVIPRTRGGRNVLSNLEPAHRSCNSARQAMPLEEWRRLHPRPVHALPPSREW